jgi:hypothetical protein
MAAEMVVMTGTLGLFALLSADQQRVAVRRLASQGWGDHDIARMCGLNVAAVRAAIAEHVIDDKRESQPWPDRST